MPSVLRRISVLVAAVAAALSLVPAAAFSNAEIGSKIERRELGVFGGGTRSYLGDADANVFIFFRPGQEHSRELASSLGGLIRETEGRSVDWVAIVSGSFSAEEIGAFVDETGLTMPVLIDEGDALYGELGARLHPVLGIADADATLVAYQHFTKVNMVAALRGRILHQLGEISDEELARIERPERTAPGNGKAESNLKLARKLLEAGKADKALEFAGKSLELDPTLAAAHAVFGAALAAQGDCAAALEAFSKALELDPEEPTALEGRKGCGGGG